MVMNIVGPPARGDDFFDREEELGHLWDRLEGGSVLLAAPSRFGKTSLMYRLLDAPKPQWSSIHVDAESIREPVNFVLALLGALTADKRIRRFLLDRWKAAGRWIRDLLDDWGIATPWDVSVRIRLKERLGAAWPERAEALLRVLRDYDGSRRLLFVIDELPLMLQLFQDSGVEKSDIRAFLYWFRSIRVDPAIGLTNCRFLVGGSIGIEHELSRLDATAAFNDFERVTLGELSGVRAREFLDLLLASRGLDIGAASRRRIIELVGAPIPYFIQVFVSEIAAARALGSRAAMGPKRLEAVYHERILGVVCKTYFQHYYERRRYYDRAREAAAKALLKELALAQPRAVPRTRLRTVFRTVLGEAATDKVFAGLVADLENDFYVRYDRDSEGHEFASKILCDWWRRYYAF